MGIPLCFGHHHLVHDAGWAIAYDPATATITLTAPDGRTITATDPDPVAA